MLPNHANRLLTRHVRGSFYVPFCRDVDRQHIQDREKWKRETAAKIKDTKIKMMKLTGKYACWLEQDGSVHVLCSRC